MRYVYFGNNRIARDVLRAAVALGRRPVGLVVHAMERASYREEIVAAAGLDASAVRDASTLATAEGHSWLASLKADWLVSVAFGHVLRSEILQIPRRGAVNLHTALLPYNRGAYPNVWCIVEKTPAGVTLHHMTEDVDAGDIIAQVEVPIELTDTGATLYERLERAAVELMSGSWQLLDSDVTPRIPQVGGPTLHRVADVARIDRIDPDRMIRAGDLIDILRARTFAPHPGAFIEVGGKRIGIRVELTELDPHR